MSGSVFTIGQHNAITASGIYKDVPTTITYIPDSSYLDTIDDAEPGDFAATYGLGSWYQWDGTEWQEV